MAIKKAGLPNWYIMFYSIICIIDGIVGIVTLGFYTSNLQMIVALWYAQRKSTYRSINTGRDQYIRDKNGHYMWISEEEDEN